MYRVSGKGAAVRLNCAISETAKQRRNYAFETMHPVSGKRENRVKQTRKISAHRSAILAIRKKRWGHSVNSKLWFHEKRGQSRNDKYSALFVRQRKRCSFIVTGSRRGSFRFEWRRKENYFPRTSKLVDATIVRS